MLRQLEILEGMGMAVESDYRSGRSLDRRSGLAAAMATRQGITVTSIDRLTRSVADFDRLVAAARAGNFPLVVLDLGIDAASESDYRRARSLVRFHERQAEMIGSRTREALDKARRDGVRLGRPRGVPPEVAGRIRQEREAGASLAVIAAGLNRAGVATGQGGARWWPSTVLAVLNRRD